MIQQITKPFRDFFKLEASSGIMLLIAAILALVISNGSYSDEYFSILKKYITLGTDSFGLKLSVLHWINDVLMAIFFFFVSLEIKREFLQGELSNPKQALLPIIGAVGGMVVGILLMLFYMTKFKFGWFGGGGEQDWWLGISPEGFGSFAMLVNFVVSLVISKFTPAPSEDIQKLIENIRNPDEE